MKYRKLQIKGVIEFFPTVYQDKRGFFCETFRLKNFKKIINSKKITFVQDNLTESKKNTLRGLHYQIENTQDKLISVLTGEIYDVAVDLRTKSPTFGKYISCKLSSKKKNLLWIPKGFAHGFYVLSKTALVSYKVTDYYNKKAEKTLFWNDDKVNIKWPFRKKPIISKKDKKGIKLHEIKSNF